MRRREPPEGWQPGYNCAAPPANECHCYADCMFDGSRWRIAGMDVRAGTATIYRDLSGYGRSQMDVAIDRVSSPEWHESLNCEHRVLSGIVHALNTRVSQSETGTVTD